MTTAPAATPPRRRSRAFRAAVVVGAAALTLGIVEAVLAVADLPPPDPYEAAEAVDPRLFDVDPKLLWRLHRSATLDFPDLGFQNVHVNARGLRGADRDDAWTASRLRVLCVGDSVTFGPMMKDDETLPARLEAELRRRFPSDVAPVVWNAGTPGWSTVQGLRVLDELAPLAPDVVVWWFGMNDAKPAMGRPDAEVGAEDLGNRPLLRRLRVVRFAESIGASMRPEKTRVSPEEVRAAVAESARREAAGGPTTVHVRCPQRLGEKLAQFDATLAALRAAGASRVDGAVDALSQYVPGPPGCEVVARVEERDGRRVAVLGAGNYGRETIDVAELERRRDALVRWKKAVDAYVAEMPASALGYADLFGGLRPDQAFSDDCHMNAQAVPTAARALASRIEALVARRGGPRKP